VKELMFTRRRIIYACAAVLLYCSATAAATHAPLADAAEKRDAIAIRSLLSQKVGMNEPQADGMTAVHWAVYHDDAEAVKLLIAAGADVKPANRYGVTPLSIACENGSTPIVEMLLDAGADPKTSLPGGETVLMTAARTGQVGAVNALLSRGAPVDARERKGQTALMWAAAEGNVEVVDALLKAGADFQTPLSSGFTPLFFAVREGRTDVVFRLLKAGANVNEVMKLQNGASTAHHTAINPLLLAIENGHFELAAALLSAGADPNSHPSGYTPLHAITWVRKPLRGDGNPPPYGSGTLGSLDLVRVLIENRADINARLENGTSARGRFTTTGSTPFELAARNSDVPLMQLLIERGANRQLANADDCTPILAACGVGAVGPGDETAGTEEEAIGAVRLLLKLGANVNDVDKNGETVMHGAAYQSRDKMIQVLADAGADIKIWNRKNKFGWTPLMIAQGNQPENFRLAPETIAVLERVMRGNGVDPPTDAQVVQKGQRNPPIDKK
jgi:ankyrin repeat protein